MKTSSCGETRQRAKLALAETGSCLLTGEVALLGTGETDPRNLLLYNLPFFLNAFLIDFTLSDLISLYFKILQYT